MRKTAFPVFLGTNIMILIFYYLLFFWCLLDLGETLYQNEISADFVLLEFLQVAPEKEVPEISEESLFFLRFPAFLHLDMSK